MGYGYRQPLKQLRIYRDRQGKAYYKEVNNGYEYPSFIRSYKDEKGIIKWLSWTELEKEFV